MFWSIVEKIFVFFLVTASTIYIISLVYKAVFGKDRYSACAGCPSRENCSGSKDKKQSIKIQKDLRCHDGTSSK